MAAMASILGCGGRVVAEVGIIGLGIKQVNHLGGVYAKKGSRYVVMVVAISSRIQKTQRWHDLLCKPESRI